MVAFRQVLNHRAGYLCVSYVRARHNRITKGSRLICISDLAVSTRVIDTQTKCANTRDLVTCYYAIRGRYTNCPIEFNV